MLIRSWHSLISAWKSQPATIRGLCKWQIEKCLRKNPINVQIKIGHFRRNPSIFDHHMKSYDKDFTCGGFLKIGVSPRIIHFHRIFHCKPSSYWGTTVTMETAWNCTDRRGPGRPGRSTHGIGPAWSNCCRCHRWCGIPLAFERTDGTGWIMMNPILQKWNTAEKISLFWKSPTSSMVSIKEVFNNLNMGGSDYRRRECES